MTPAILLAALSVALPVTPPGTSGASAQITVSFSSQGASVLKALTGKRISGVSLNAVVVCSASPATIPIGRIYQLAAQHGISYLKPEEARALILRTVSFNWTNLLLDALTDGPQGAAFLGASKLVSMSNPVIAALIGSSAIIGLATKRIKTFAPDPSPLLKDLLDPKATMTFTTAGCNSGIIATRYKGRKSDNSDGIWTLQN